MKNCLRIANAIEYNSMRVIFKVIERSPRRSLHWSSTLRISIKTVKIILHDRLEYYWFMPLRKQVFLNEDEIILSKNGLL